MARYPRSGFQVVDTPFELTEMKRRFEGEKTIAVDLEADSLYHFTEKVCLIQIAVPGYEVIIDALKVRDLSSLHEIFAGHRVRKVFHGADYDIRSLYRDFHIEINNLFDTELAARFLGIQGTGLEAMLHAFFGCQLNKKYQKTDWSRRPIPSGMLEYAAEDVRHLIALSNILENDLTRKGRMAWVEEECALLSRVRPAVLDDDPLYLKFKGAGKFTPRQLAVLEALLQFRKRMALNKDKPLFQILRNKSLQRIATALPASLAVLEKAGVLSEKELRLYGGGIIEAVKEAVRIPEKSLPKYPHKRGPMLSSGMMKRINMLKDWREDKATSLGMDPSLILTRTMLCDIAIKKPIKIEDFRKIIGMRNWQKSAFGEEILAVLHPAKQDLEKPAVG